MTSYNDTENLCPICFGTLIDVDYVELEACKHVFCEECFNEFEVPDINVVCPVDMMKSETIMVNGSEKSLLDYKNNYLQMKYGNLVPTFQDCIKNYFVECKDMIDDAKETFKNFETLLKVVSATIRISSSAAWLPDKDIFIEKINNTKLHFLLKNPALKIPIMNKGDLLTKLDCIVPKLEVMKTRKYPFAEMMRIRVDKCTFIIRKLTITCQDLLVSRLNAILIGDLMIFMLENLDFTDISELIRELRALNDKVIASTEDSLMYLRVLSTVHNCGITSILSSLFTSDSKSCLVCLEELRANSYFGFKNCEHGLCTKCTDTHLLVKSNCPFHEGANLQLTLDLTKRSTLTQERHNNNIFLKTMNNFLLSMIDSYDKLLQNLEELKLGIKSFLSLVADKSEETTLFHELLLPCAKTLYSQQMTNHYLSFLIYDDDLLDFSDAEYLEKATSIMAIYSMTHFLILRFSEISINSLNENLINKIIQVIIEPIRACNEKRTLIQGISLEIDHNLEHIHDKICKQFPRIYTHIPEEVQNTFKQMISKMKNTAKINIFSEKIETTNSTS